MEQTGDLRQRYSSKDGRYKFHIQNLKLDAAWMSSNGKLDTYCGKKALLWKKSSCQQNKYGGRDHSCYARGDFFGILRFLKFLQRMCIVFVIWRNIPSQITCCKLCYEASCTLLFSIFKTRTWEESYRKVYTPWVKLLMVLVFNSMFQPFVNWVQKTTA